LGDCDNGPTKKYLVDHKDDDDEHRRLYELSFGKRPEFELYDMEKDPGQMNNVADQVEYADVKQQLQKQLKTELASTSDPRETGGDAEQIFDKSEYFGGGPRHPGLPNPNKKKKN
jgi:hypothetical protein